MSEARVAKAAAAQADHSEGMSFLSTLPQRVVRTYIPLALIVFVLLFPFYWMLITSIKPNRELYSQKIMPLVVYQPTLKHYIDLLWETNFLVWTCRSWSVS